MCTGSVELAQKGGFPDDGWGLDKRLLRRAEVSPDSWSGSATYCSKAETGLSGWMAFRKSRSCCMMLGPSAVRTRPVSAAAGTGSSTPIFALWQTALKFRRLWLTEIGGKMGVPSIAVAGILSGKSPSRNQRCFRMASSVGRCSEV